MTDDTENTEQRSVAADSPKERLVMRFIHDCDKCKPLGMMGDFDLYYCDQTGNVPTVIARFGDDGPEYISGLNSGNSILKIAKAMAVEHGYINA